MAQPHTKSGDVTSMAPLGPLIIASKSTAIIKAEQLEVVRLVLHAGKVLHEHRAPGEITVLCIEGSVEFSTPEKTTILNQSDFLHLGATIPHALKAVTDCSILVTICLPPK